MMLAQARSGVAKQLTSSGRLSNTGRESDVRDERQDFWRTVKVWEYVNVFEYVKPWQDIHSSERRILRIIFFFYRIFFRSNVNSFPSAGSFNLKFCRLE